MTRTVSFEQMKVAFATNSSTSEGSSSDPLYFPFWKMRPGTTTTIRFLPDQDDNNPKGFILEKVFHRIDGKYEKCTGKETCPYCIKSAELYANKNEIEGKKFYKKKSYIANAIIVDFTDDETGQKQTNKFAVVDMNTDLYKRIQTAYKNGDLDSFPDDAKNGYDFRITKEKDGKYFKYDGSFAKKPRALSTDEKAHFKLVKDLKTLL